MTGITAVESRIICAVLLPLAAALLVFALGGNGRAKLRGSIMLAASLITAGAVFSLTPHVLADEARFDILHSADISLTLRADNAGFIFICAVTIVWLLASVYSFGYAKYTDVDGRRACDAAAALSVCALEGIGLSANLHTFCVFSIVLAAAVIVQTLTKKGKAEALSWVLIAVLIAGNLALILASVQLSSEGGSSEFQAGGCLADGVGAGDVMMPLMLLIIAGLAMIWAIPCLLGTVHQENGRHDATDVLYAATAAGAGVFCFIRTILYVFGPELAKSCRGIEILAWATVLTIILSPLIAFRHKGLCARLAYTVPGQMGYAALGVCAASPFSAAGAIFYIAAQTLLKATAIMAGGALDAAGDTSEQSGDGSRPGLAFGIYIAAAAGLAGFPPFAGFAGKTNILYGTIAAGGPALTVALIGGSLLELACLMYPAVTLNRIGEHSVDGSHKMKESPAMATAMIAGILFATVLGIFPDAGLHLFELAMEAGNSVFVPLM